MVKLKHVKSDLKDIIGMQCTYNYGDSLDLWNDNNTIRCEVIDAYAYIEDSSLEPFLEIGICVIPIGQHKLDQHELDYMQSGVSPDRVKNYKTINKNEND